MLTIHVIEIDQQTIVCSEIFEVLINLQFFDVMVFFTNFLVLNALHRGVTFLRILALFEHILQIDSIHKVNRKTSLIFTFIHLYIFFASLRELDYL